MLNSPLKQRVSSFLVNQGAPPQVELKENCNQIFSLMQRHRSDEEFWAPFTDLLRTLVDDVVASNGSNALNSPEAKFLATWDVNFLAQRLREALPHADNLQPSQDTAVENSGWSGFARGLSPNLLGAFLLIGLAASACSGTGPGIQNGYAGGSNASGGFGGPSTGGAVSIGGAINAGGNGGTSSTIQHDAGSTGGTNVTTTNPLPVSCNYDTALSLWETIDASTLSQNQKQSLYSCFKNLNASWCDGLVALFKTETPQVIASQLQQMLLCCSMKPAAIGGDYSAAQQMLLLGSLCMVPLYKGVTFPS
jgi:hypothetical protein